MTHLLLAGLVGLLPHVVEAPAETILLRDRQGTIDARLVGFEPGGARILVEAPAPSPAVPGDGEPDAATVPDSPPAVARVVPWDRIRGIEGIEDPVLESQWATRWRGVSEDLWRARSRLQRGDRALAEPLFARHFELVTSDPEGSELALVVAEGLLRSRLRSGEVEALVPAALETVRLRRAGFETDRYRALPAVIDERLWLVPRLAPVPTRVDLDPTSMRSMVRRWSDDPDEVVSGLARAYARMHDPPDALLLGGEEPAGPSLVLAALATRSSDPTQRAAARERFRSLVPGMDAEPVYAPWRGWFLGTSALLEADPLLDPALLELLALPAEHLHHDPALAIRALSVGADALDAAGRGGEAAVLRREITRLDFTVAPALPAALGHDLPASDAPSEEETR